MINIVKKKLRNYGEGMESDVKGVILYILGREDWIYLNR